MFLFIDDLMFYEHALHSGVFSKVKNVSENDFEINKQFF